MPKKTGPKYTGILNKPIRPPKSDQELTPEELAADFEQQFMARVAALYDHYGLKFGQPGAHAILAVNLAADHIEGFRVVMRRPGRSKKWKGDGGRKLVAEVEAIVDRGQTPNRAFTLLTKPGAPYEKENPKSLKSRYHEICNADPQAQFFKWLKTDIRRMDKTIELFQAALGTEIKSK